MMRLRGGALATTTNRRFSGQRTRTRTPRTPSKAPSGPPRASRGEDNASDHPVRGTLPLSSILLGGATLISGGTDVDVGCAQIVDVVLRAVGFIHAGARDPEMHN
jgi:hypothetical protein